MGAYVEVSAEVGMGDEVAWGFTYQRGVARFQNGGSYWGGDRIAYQTYSSIMDYADVHTKECGEWMAGAYAGAGAGFFITSADSAQDFAALRQTFSINTPIVSVGYSYDNDKGNFTVSVTFGSGAVGSVSNYKTETRYIYW